MGVVEWALLGRLVLKKHINLPLALKSGMVLVYLKRWLRYMFIRFKVRMVDFYLIIWYFVVMSSRAEKIIELSEELRADENRKGERDRVLNEGVENSKLKMEEEKEKAVWNKYVEAMSETGVVEIFNELLDCIPRSEVVWGCEGSRISLLMPVVVTESVDDFTGYSSYHYSRSYITVRLVDKRNLKSHLDDDFSKRDYSSLWTSKDRSIFKPKETFWGNPIFGFYVNDDLVNRGETLDHLIAEKLASPGVDGYVQKWYESPNSSDIRAGFGL